MDDAVVKRIQSDPNYIKLVAERNSFGWTLSIIMLAVYYGFIALVAFAPSVIGIKIAGAITVGVVMGAAIIVLAIVLTGIYVAARGRAIRRTDQGDRRRQRHGRQDMSRLIKSGALGPRRSRWPPARRCAAEPIAAGTDQSVDWNAVVIFAAFVILTLGITYWAAKRTRTAKDFYAAGGGITGFQNGLAIAGDYMSAASFLGISALVYTSGYDGLIYSIGLLVGWPIIMFLIAEPLRNLGRFTFADVAVLSPAGDADPRHGGDAARWSTVAFYLIAQMVGAGQLIKLLFGLDYLYAVVMRRRADDHLRHLRRHDRHHLGADHQGRPAADRRDPDGAPGARRSSASTSTRCSPRRSKSIPQHDSDHAARAPRSPTRSRRSRSAWR